jgi:hypothetical protein
MTQGQFIGGVLSSIAASAIVAVITLAVRGFNAGVLLSTFDRVAYWLFGSRYGYAVMRRKALRRGWGVIGIVLVGLLLASLALFITTVFLRPRVVTPSTSLIVFAIVQASVLGFLLFYQGRWLQITLGGLQGWVSEKAQMRKYEYSEYKILYFVSSRRRDTWSRKIVIHAREDMVGIKTIDVGVTSGASQGHRTPMSLRLSAATDPGKGSVLLFPFLKGRTWHVSTLFTEPIQPNETRNLIVSGVCRDTWRPLRETGSDRGSFELAKPAGLLELVIVLPVDMASGSITRRSVTTREEKRAGTFLRKLDDDTVGTLREDIDQHGRRQLIWSVPNAKPGKYEYTVKACPVAVPRGTHS